jgi:hypothetical protein
MSALIRHSNVILWPCLFPFLEQRYLSRDEIVLVHNSVSPRGWTSNLDDIFQLMEV